MRSRLFLGLFVTSFGAAALASTGCGGGGETGGGGSTTTGTDTTTTTTTTTGTTTTGTTTSTGSTTTSTTTVTTSSTSTTTSTCATTFATAQAIEVSAQDPTACALPDPVNGANYFKFTGTKGQAVVVITSAKVGGDPFDPTYLDTVVTLYDAQMNQIAQNDDPTPRYSNDAEVWTVLPANGDYVIAVQECNAVFGTANCADAANITTNDYTVQVFETDGSAPVVTSEIFADGSGSDAPNDATNPGGLTAVKYEFGDSDYLLSRIIGRYDTATDVDVYSFTLPADTTFNADGRPLANFFPLPAGTDGNGSSTPVGKLWVVDPADLTHRVVEVDASVGATAADIGAPLTLDKEYYLFVGKPAGASGANDFYVLNHYAGGSNPIEGDDLTNGLIATPEVLFDAGEADFLASYFVDGNLAPAATDVDFYSLAVPSGAATISVACGAQRSGSGLRSMKFEVRTPTNTLVGTTQTDVPDDDVFLDKVAVPAGATTLLVKVYGATQDATVTSNFYRCGIRFQ